MLVKLVKSINGCKKKQVSTAKALGFRKIGQIVEKPDNDAIRGMIRSIFHLVEIVNE